MADITATAEWAAAEADANAWEAAHPEIAQAAAEDEAADAGEQTAEGEGAAEQTEVDAADGKPAADAGKPKPAADPLKVKRDQLAALAGELGMKVVGEQVLVEERAKFREEKRTHREKAAAWEAQAQRLVTEKLEPAWKAVQLIEAGDLDAGLKALTGKDLTQLNKDAIAAASGADWETRREMQRIKAEREQEKAQMAQWQAQEQQRQQQAQAQAYQVQVRGELTKSEDKAVAALANELPWFADAVIAEQRASYDPDDGSTLLLPVAASRVLAKYRAEYERVHKILGGPVAPKTAESGLQAPEKPAQPRNGKTPGLTNAAGSQLVAGRRSAPLSDAEFRAMAIRELKAATG